MGTNTRYHIILLRRYRPVRDTGIMPEDTCSKAMKGHIIVLCRYSSVQDTQIMTKRHMKQGCDRPNEINYEGPNVRPNQTNAVVDSS